MPPKKNLSASSVKEKTPTPSPSDIVRDQKAIWIKNVNNVNARNEAGLKVIHEILADKIRPINATVTDAVAQETGNNMLPNQFVFDMLMIWDEGNDSTGVNGVLFNNLNKIIFREVRNRFLTRILNEHGIEDNMNSFKLPDGQTISTRLEFSECYGVEQLDDVSHDFFIRLTARLLLTFYHPTLQNNIGGKRVTIEDLTNIAFRVGRKITSEKVNYIEADYFYMIMVAFSAILSNRNIASMQEMEEQMIKFFKHPVIQLKLENFYKERLSLLDNLEAKNVTLTGGEKYVKHFNLINTNLITLKEDAIRFARTPEIFDDMERSIKQKREQIRRAAENRAMDYFERLKTELENEQVENERKSLTQLSIADKKDGANLNKNIKAEAGATAKSEKSEATASKIQHKSKDADFYLSNVISNNLTIYDKIKSYVEATKKEKMITVGRKQKNIIAIRDENLFIVLNLNHAKPLIYVFNKNKIPTEDSLLEQLTTNEIDYYGQGEHGSKIAYNPDETIQEIHLKYYINNRTESMRLPNTYITNLPIGGIICNIAYFDQCKTAHNWHRDGFDIEQHQQAPAVLSKVLSPENENKEKRLKHKDSNTVPKSTTDKQNKLQK